MTIQEMREKRGTLTAKLRKMLDETPASNWKDSHQRTYDAAMKEIADIDAEVERQSRLMDLEAERMFRDAGRTTSTPTNSGWTDVNGRPVSVLGPQDKLLDTVRRNYDIDADDRAPGDALAQLVTAAVSGRSDDSIKALTTGADSEGGAWLVPEVSAGIIDLARGLSVATMAGMRTISMESPELKLVRVAADAEPAWIGEQSKVTRNEPSFGALRLVARKLIVHVPVSSELLEDASNLQSELSNLLARAFAAEIDRIALAGDGKRGQPTGVLFTDGIQGQTPSAYDYEALLDSLQALEAENHPAGSIVHEPALARTLRGLREGSGTGQYLAPPPDLADVPRFVSTRLPTNRAIIGDFRESILGVRSQLAIGVNTQAGLERDEVIVTARWRGDFGIARPKAFVTLNVGA